MDENISKGLFGLNKREVENYIITLKGDYEAELKRQNTELQNIKGENVKLNEMLNKFLEEKKQIEETKQSISDVLFKAEQQAKQIIEDAKKQANDEKEEINVLLEQEKEKLIDARIELATLKDKAKDVVTKFSCDIENL